MYIWDYIGIMYTFDEGRKQTHSQEKALLLGFCCWVVSKIFLTGFSPLFGEDELVRTK